MTNSAIPTSARYQSDGTTCAWPVPFPFGNPSQVGVRTMDAQGFERDLAYGADYIIKDNCVMCVVPRGGFITVWLNCPLDEAVASNVARVMANNSAVSQSMVSAAVEVPQDSTANAETAKEIANLAAKINELTAKQDNALLQARLAEEDRQIKRIAEEGDKAADAVSRAVVQACGDAETRLERASAKSVDEVKSVSANAAHEAEAARLQAEAAIASANAAIRQLEAARAAFDKAVADAGKAVEEAQDSARQSIEMLAGQASVAMAAAESDATKRIRRDSDLHNACINQHGSFIQTADWKAGSIIPLPEGMVYYPGRAMLRITYQGRTLVQDVDWQEVANVDDVTGPSPDIRIMINTQKDAVWSFWVVASNASAKAIEAAAAAETARRRAEEWAFNSREYARGVETAKNEAEASAKNADAWRKCSAQSAAAAHEMAHAAWLAGRDWAYRAADSAWQATVACCRPGIAAVRSFDELAHAVSGIYIINPHITKTPTPFMGVWPAQSMADMKWDGIFFFGPAYPDNPAMPPAPDVPYPDPDYPDAPVRPEPPTGPQLNSKPQWGPCGHNHS